MSKKIKLDDAQKQRLKNLECYMAKGEVAWIGNQNLKACMLDGPYAVLFGRYVPDPYELEFRVESLVCCESILTAIATMRYSPGGVFRLLDLEKAFVVEELRKINKGFRF